ncbi:MAG: hypothetical protein ACLFV7_03990 [Phycisphaerae bacterium]
MAEKPDNLRPDDGMEHLLRKWGAQEASRPLEVPPAPQTRTAAGVAGIWRWVPLAAAAMLLAVAGWVYYQAVANVAPDAARMAATEQRPSTDRQKLLAEVQRLKDRLRRLRGEKDAARSALEQAAQRLAQVPVEKQQLRRELEEEFQRALESELAALRRSEVDPKVRRLTELKTELDEANRTVAALRESVRTLGPDARQAAKLRAQIAILEKKADATRTELAGEVQRLRGERDEALAMRLSGEQEIAELAEQLRSTLGQMQLVYLQSDESTLQARQRAAARNRLARRCSLAAAATGSDPTRTLLSQLEVVLLRLQLVEEGSDELASLGRTLKREGLIGRIDRTVLARDADGPTRRLLLETRLVLMGLGDAA